MGWYEAGNDNCTPFLHVTHLRGVFYVLVRQSVKNADRVLNVLPLIVFDSSFLVERIVTLRFFFSL